MKNLGLYVVTLGCFVLLVGYGYYFWLNSWQFNIIVIEGDYLSLAELKAITTHSLFANVFMFIGFFITLMGLCTIIMERRNKQQ